MTTVVQLAGSAATVVPTATAVPAAATAPTPGVTRATVRRVVRRLTPATLAGVAGRPTRACAVSIVRPMPATLNRLGLVCPSCTETGTAKSSAAIEPVSASLRGRACMVVVLSSVSSIPLGAGIYALHGCGQLNKIDLDRDATEQIWS